LANSVSDLSPAQLEHHLGDGHRDVYCYVEQFLLAAHRHQFDSDVNNSGGHDPGPIDLWSRFRQALCDGGTRLDPDCRCLLASIPTAAAYILFQKRVTQGVMAAAGLK